MAELGYKRPHRITIGLFLKKANISPTLIYDDEFKAKLFALRDGPPPAGALGWTLNSLADKMAELGYKRPHKTTVRTILRKGNMPPSPPSIYDDEFKAKLFALRAGPPPAGALKWTRDLLADKMAELGYKRPHRTTVGLFLKKANISLILAYDDEFKAKLIALRDGPPPAGALKWTLDSLADKMTELGYKRPSEKIVAKILRSADNSASPV
jgi:hypothetical protein